MGRLILFHHAPGADDQTLDALAEHWRGYDGVEVTLAMEGAEVSL